MDLGKASEGSSLAKSAAGLLGKLSYDSGITVWPRTSMPYSPRSRGSELSHSIWLTPTRRFSFPAYTNDARLNVTPGHADLDFNFRPEVEPVPGPICRHRNCLRPIKLTLPSLTHRLACMNAYRSPIGNKSSSLLYQAEKGE